MQITHLRRHLAPWLVAFILAVPLSPAVIGAGVPAVAAASVLGATVSVLSTPVEVATSDPGVFVTATDGQTLYQGNSIRTGPGGIALLTFFDGSEAQLGGESQVQIEQAEATPAPQIAMLQTAGVTVNHVIPMPPDGSYRTDTPAATGLVRGTSYIVVVDSTATCGPDGVQACSASMILLTDRNGHVGRVDVTANSSSAPSVQLASAGDAAAASRLVVVGTQIDPSALADLEAVAHVRHDSTASLTTEQAARAIATTLLPLVVAAPSPDLSVVLTVPPVTPQLSVPVSVATPERSVDALPVAPLNPAAHATQTPSLPGAPTVMGGQADAQGASASEAGHGGPSAAQAGASHLVAPTVSGSKPAESALSAHVDAGTTARAAAPAAVTAAAPATKQNSPEAPKAATAPASSPSGGNSSPSGSSGSGGSSKSATSDSEHSSRSASSGFGGSSKPASSDAGSSSKSASPESGHASTAGSTMPGKSSESGHSSDSGKSSENGQSSNPGHGSTSSQGSHAGYGYGSGHSK